MNGTISQKRELMLVLLATALVVAMTPFASASGVTCRTGNSCLNGTYHFDWTANYGPPFSPIPDGSFAHANHAFIALVNFAGGGNGERRDQGNGWAGNFTNSDELLWTNSPGQGPLNLHFFWGPGVQLLGVGANIQTHFYGPFTALIQGFDFNGNLIDSFSEDGNSNPNGDGSAIFIGLANDPGIRSVEFSITSCAFDCNDFAINQLDMSWRGFPEPTSVLLMGTGLFGLAGITRKRLRKRS
jgi:PEP-CTERM motif